MFVVALVWGTFASLRGSAEKASEAAAVRSSLTQDDCTLLEKAMTYSPPSKCQFFMLAENKVACECSVHMVGSAPLMPNTLANPFAPPIPPDPNIPAFPGLPSVPAPSNKLAPYLPPPTLPHCPFEAGGEVDFAAWGFSSVDMGKYTPATSYGNILHCFFTMPSDGVFTVPERVQKFFDAGLGS